MNGRAYVRLGRRELELRDGDLGLLNLGGTASRLDHVLGEDQASAELSVVDGASDLLHNLDVPQVNVGVLVGIHHVDDRVHSNGGKDVGVLGHNLGVERGDGALQQGVAIGEVDGVGHVSEELNTLERSLLQTLRNLGRVDALLKEDLTGVEQASSKNHNTGRAISGLNILSLGHLGELCAAKRKKARWQSGQQDRTNKKNNEAETTHHLGSRVLYSHGLDNGGTIVGDDDLLVSLDDLKRRRKGN